MLLRKEKVNLRGSHTSKSYKEGFTVLRRIL